MTIDPDDPANYTPLQNLKVVLIPFLIAIALLIGVAIFPIPKQESLVSLFPSPFCGQSRLSRALSAL